MRSNFTSLLFLAVFTIISSVTHAQSEGDFRSVNAAPPAGGNWGDVTKWERFTAGSWVAAPSTPVSTDGVITIRTGDSILINIAVTVDEVIVASGGVLTANTTATNTTLNNGAGDDLTVNGTLFLRNVRTINGPGNIVVNGTFNWISGTLAAPTTSAIGSTTNLSLNFLKTMSANFINNGTFNWATGAASGGISLVNSIFTNNGTINEQFSSDRGFLNGGGTVGFVNSGTFNKTTTFIFANNTVPFTNTGTVGGLGSLSLNGTVTNTGSLRPGASPGVLTISPVAVTGQATTINIEIVDGSGAGTGHDQLALTGNTTLTSATLTVNEPGPAAPLQAYTVLTTSGTFTGTFATVNMPSGYIITYNAASVVVTKLSFPLPAVWGDFTALSKTNAVTLNWNTLQEYNTSHYIVEHSTDGRYYAPIATLPAKGNTGLPSSYSYTHKTPNVKSKNFYRIQLADLDSRVSFSETRLVKFSKNGVKSLVVTPNPVQTTLNLYAQETIEIRLMDITGRLIKSQILTPGNHKIDVSALKAGMYILNVFKDGTFAETQQIIKQ